MFKSDSHLTKRQLGFIAVVVGIVALIGIFLYDSLGAGNGDFGPTQKIALWVAFLMILIGLTLVPLGDQAA